MTAVAVMIDPMETTKNTYIQCHLNIYQQIKRLEKSNITNITIRQIRSRARKIYYFRDRSEPCRLF